MDNLALRAFVERAKESGAVRYGDLRRLQRDVLPVRITTSEEASLLIELDRVTPHLDRDWSDYPVEAVRDFVVWGIDPAGVIDRDNPAPPGA